MNWKKLFYFEAIREVATLQTNIYYLQKSWANNVRCILKILAEIPSKPVAFVASKDLMHVTRSASLTEGILNLVFCRILLST